MSEKYSSLTYLNAANMVKFKFDKLILSHAQVKHLTDRLIQKFLFPGSKSEKDKIVLNIADMFNSNNNCGFNLKNFKVKYINEFFQDIISDYEKSIIGTFTKNLLQILNLDQKLKDKYEIYFTITKFENDYGYSLVHQDAPASEIPAENSQIDPENQDILSNNQEGATNKINIEGTQNLNNKSATELQQRELSPRAQREEAQRQKRKEALNKHGVIPEFIKISEVYQIYTAFTQANLKNSILHQRQALENAKQ
jgi:hypothetical protein